MRKAKKNLRSIRLDESGTVINPNGEGMLSHLSTAPAVAIDTSSFRYKTDVMLVDAA